MLGRTNLNELSSLDRSALLSNDETAFRELQMRQTQASISDSFMTIRETSQQAANALGDVLLSFFRTGEINFRRTLGNALLNITETVISNSVIRPAGEFISNFLIASASGVISRRATAATSSLTPSGAATAAPTAGTIAIMPLASINAGLTANDVINAAQINANSLTSSAISNRFRT